MYGRKLLLISLDWTRPKDPPLSLGHASILANLVKHQIAAHPASWAVNSRSFRSSDVVSHIMSKADAKTDVALGAFVWNENATQDIFNSLKKMRFPGKIIVGGPQVSYVRKNLDSYYSQPDIFIRGYGEEALAKLYQSTEEKPVIKGVSYRGEADLGLSSTVDLEKLPSPYLTGIIEPQHFIRWETQRGCPFKCSFCQHREPNASMVRRNMLLSRVLKEAEWIADNKVIQDVAVLDPTFNSGPYYLNVLDKLIEGKYTGKLSLQCRMEMVTPIFLQKLKELNRTAEVVLEFGLQTIHREEQRVIERPNSIKKVIEVLKETREAKIKTEVSLIFGLPNQTLQSFRESVDFCRSHEVPVIRAFPLMLLRGTPLHDNKKLLGLVESSDVDIPGIDRIQKDIPHVVSSPSFSLEEWLKMAEIARGLEISNNQTQ